jgi:hypothetical protein
MLSSLEEDAALSETDLGEDALPMLPWKAPLRWIGAAMFVTHVARSALLLLCEQKSCR